MNSEIPDSAHFKVGSLGIVWGSGVAEAKIIVSQGLAKKQLN